MERDGAMLLLPSWQPGGRSQAGDANAWVKRTLLDTGLFLRAEGGRGQELLLLSSRPPFLVLGLLPAQLHDSDLGLA